MTDFISRKAALNFETKITAAPSEIQAISQGMSLYAEHIKAIPAADVAPVVHGYNKLDCTSLFECSVCGWECYDTFCGDGPYNYCPNCGAKMDGGTQDAVD